MSTTATTNYQFVTEKEELKLRVCFFNYLLLDQFELARAVLRQLFTQHSPSHALSLLRYVLLQQQQPSLSSISPSPSNNSAPSPLVLYLKPTPKLLWFCLTEYKYLTLQLSSTSSPSPTPNSSTPSSARAGDNAAALSSLAENQIFAEEVVEFELLVDFAKNEFGKQLKEILDTMDVEQAFQQLQEFFYNQIRQNPENASKFVVSSVAAASSTSSASSSQSSTAGMPKVSSSNNLAAMGNSVSQVIPDTGSVPFGLLPAQAFNLLRELCILSPELGHAVCKGLWTVFDNNYCSPQEPSQEVPSSAPEEPISQASEKFVSMQEKFQFMLVGIVFQLLEHREISNACYFLRFLEVTEKMVHVLPEVDKLFNAFVQLSIKYERDEQVSSIIPTQQQTLSSVASSSILTSQVKLEHVDVKLLVYESLLANDYYSIAYQEKKASNPTKHFLLSRYCKLEEEAIAAMDMISFFERSNSVYSIAKSHKTEKKANFDSLFWNPFVSYIRTTNSHILESVLLKCLDAIKKRNFEQLALLMTPPHFSNLKPLILLLSWDDLIHDMDALQKLFDILWNSTDAVPATPTSVTGNKDELVQFACNDLSFCLQVSWWISNQILELPTNINNNIVRVKEILKVLSNEDITTTGSGSTTVPQYQRLANVVLRQLQYHSVAYILLPWLPFLKDNDILKLLQKRPLLNNAEEVKFLQEKAQRQVLRSRTEMSILHGYYAIHNFLIILIKLHNNSAESSNVSNAEIQEYVSKIKHNVENIPAAAFQLIILEDIFSLLFLRKEHLKSSKPHNASKKQKNNPFIINEVLIQQIVLMLEETAGVLEKNNSKELEQLGMQNRLKKIIESIQDAKWRFQFVKWVQSSSQAGQKQEVSAPGVPTYSTSLITDRKMKQFDFLQIMLSSPSTLLSIALKKGDFEKSKQVIERYQHHISKLEVLEITTAERLSILKMSAAPSASNSFADWSAPLQDILSFSVWLDVAFGFKLKQLSPNDALMQVLERSKDIALKQVEGSPAKKRAFEVLFNKLRLLLKQFDKSSFASIFNKLRTFPASTEKLQQFLDGEKQQTKQLQTLYTAVHHSTENLDLAAIRKAFFSSSLSGAEANQYLGRFLEHVLQSTLILQLQSNHFSQLLSKAPADIIAGLVFEENAYGKAASLADQYGLDLTKLVLQYASKTSDIPSVALDIKAPEASPSVTASATSGAPNPYSSSKTLPLVGSFMLSGSMMENSAPNHTPSPISPVGNVPELSSSSLSLNVVQYLATQSKLVAAMAALLLKKKDTLSGELLDFAIETIIALSRSDTITSGGVSLLSSELQGKQTQHDAPITSFVKWIGQRMTLFQDFVDIFNKVDTYNAINTKQVFPSPMNSPSKSIVMRPNSRSSTSAKQLFDGKNSYESESSENQVIFDMDVDEKNEKGEKGVNEKRGSKNMIRHSSFSSNNGESAGVMEARSPEDLEALSEYFESTPQAYLPTPVFSQVQFKDVHEQAKYVSSINLLEDNQDENFYFSIITKFLKTGDIHNALFYADKGLSQGAPDFLLKTYIEKTLEKHLTYALVPRIRDNKIAANIIFEYLEHWEIDTCIDLLQMLISRLIINLKEKPGQGSTNSSPIVGLPAATTSSQFLTYYEKGKTKLQWLLLYKKILQSKIGNTFANWPELSDYAKRSPGTLVIDLLKAQEFELARQVAKLFDPENHDLFINVEQSFALFMLNELQNQESEVLKILVSLGEDAISVCEFLIEKATMYEHKLFVCNYVLSVLLKQLTGDQVELYSFKQKGLQVLCLIPKEYQAKFKHLIHKPMLIIENLIIFQDVALVGKILKQIPDLQDDQLLLSYGKKALDVEKTAYSNTSSEDVVSHLNIVHQQQQQLIFPGTDEINDGKVRSNHYFPQAPSMLLAKSIFDLCKEPRLAGETLLKMCDAMSSLKTISKQQVIILIEQMVQYSKVCFLRDPEGHSSLPFCDTYLSRVELLKAIVYKNCHVEATLGDLTQQSKARQIRDNLIHQDCMELALNVSTRCQIETDPVWIEWGMSLLRIGKYKEAREKFRYCPPLPAAQKQSVLNRILGILEGAPSLTQMMEHMNTKQLTHGFATPPASPAKQPHSRNLSSEDPKHNSDDEDDDQDGAPSYSKRLAAATAVQQSPVPNSYSEGHDDGFVLLKSFGKAQTTTPKKGPPAGHSTPQQSPMSSASLASSNTSTFKTHMDASRIREAKHYLKLFGTEINRISFMVRNGKIEKACSFIFDKKIPATVFVDHIVTTCYNYNVLPQLQRIMKKYDPSLSKLQSYLLAICKFLSDQNSFSLLYQMQVFMGDEARAGLTCIRLFAKAKTDLENKVQNLEAAKKHFLNAMIQVQRMGSSSSSSMSYGSLGSSFGRESSGSSSGGAKKSALTEEEINRYIKTINLQIDVIKALGAALLVSATPKSPNPSSPSTSGAGVSSGGILSLFDSPKKKCEITEMLLMAPPSASGISHFDLAYRIMNEFRLPFSQLYTNTLANMARKKLANPIQDLLKNIRGTLITDEEWDAILFTLIEVYVNELKDVTSAEKLIGKLVDDSKKVKACLLTQKYKAAYLIAVKSDNVEDVKFILNHTSKIDNKNAQTVAEHCKKYLMKK